MIRYVVLGLVRDIAAWRQEHSVPFREVIAVSTRDGDRATRGLSLRPDVEVVTLPSWAQASTAVKTTVKQNLALARAVYRPAD